MVLSTTDVRPPSYIGRLAKSLVHYHGSHADFRLNPLEVLSSQGLVTEVDGRNVVEFSDEAILSLRKDKIGGSADLMELFSGMCDPVHPSFCVHKRFTQENILVEKLRGLVPDENALPPHVVITLVSLIHPHKAVPNLPLSTVEGEANYFFVRDRYNDAVLCCLHYYPRNMQPWKLVRCDEVTVTIPMGKVIVFGE